jgi:hypothetical protein
MTSRLRLFGFSQTASAVRYCLGLAWMRCSCGLLGLAAQRFIPWFALAARPNLLQACFGSMLRQSRTGRGQSPSRWRSAGRLSFRSAARNPCGHNPSSMWSKRKAGAMRIPHLAKSAGVRNDKRCFPGGSALRLYFCPTALLIQPSWRNDWRVVR